MLDRAKTTLRKHAPALAYFLKTMLRGRSGVSRSPEATFSQIYEQGTWGGAAGELDSGSGSQDAVSAPFVALIRRLIAENEIRSVADLGCGDYRVGRQLSDLPIDYTGIDVVPSLIARNNAAFGTSSVRFACKDITRDPLPPADLCIVRQVLQHLSNAQINLVLARLTSYRFVVVAEHHRRASPAPTATRTPAPTPASTSIPASTWNIRRSASPTPGSSLRRRCRPCCETENT